MNNRLHLMIAVIFALAVWTLAEAETPPTSFGDSAGEHILAISMITGCLRRVPVPRQNQ